VLLGLIVVIILLGLLFGGYRKGTKSSLPVPVRGTVHVAVGTAGADGAWLKVG
jgi:hypothetical protein